MGDHVLYILRSNFAALWFEVDYQQIYDKWSKRDELQHKWLIFLRDN